MLITDSLVSHVAAHAGAPRNVAEAALRTVLAGIGARLSMPQRMLLAEELPAPFDRDIDADTSALPIEEQVLAHAGTAGHARELIASVCRVLAEELSTEALQILRAAQPALAPFLDTPAEAYDPGRSRRPRGLARGHFGSEHPLDEARPDRTQADSVATDNPHGDRKLSSVKAPS